MSCVDKKYLKVVKWWFEVKIVEEDVDDRIVEYDIWIFGFCFGIILFCMCVKSVCDCRLNVKYCYGN